MIRRLLWKSRKVRVCGRKGPQREERCGQAGRTSFAAVVSALCFAIFLSGCSFTRADAPRLVIYSGREEQELFRLTNNADHSTILCTVPEAQIYYDDLAYEYRRLLGDGLWNGGEHKTLCGRMENVMLARLSRVKALNLMAAGRGIALEETDREDAAEAAAEYYASLSGEERERTGITEETLAAMYGEYALALRCYEYVTASIRTEISDDEARIVRVRSILFRAGDGSGDSPDGTARARALAAAQSVLREIRAGGDFDSLLLQYNEDSRSEYSLSRSGEETSDALTETAFSLDNGEISDVIETEEGYRIVRCISNFDRAETENNKARLLESRRAAAFGEQYDQFAEQVESDMNRSAMEEIHPPDGAVPERESFFECFDRIFGEDSTEFVSTHSQ
ncbi:peptidylprolyl isomerase [Lachnoclostridium sp. Marseille-P6806]|uniref:peptidylprolyl isomerase n=1 Tax=Lachnoclostridium sp. Marseille-P6806 TaxID=2364793 RepID=UPI00102FA8AA|nr:peptidylprolyl isomerase [Lachnoclostridium sp. Marseille-P6806]